VDYERTKATLAALERHGARYVVFGAVALNLQGLARFTTDFDLFIAPEAANVERVKAALREVFGDPEIDKISAEDIMGAYPAVQYVPPAGDFHIDLVARLGEAFRFEDVEAERLPFEELTVSVATPRMLYRMKKDTVRLKDRADAEALRQRFHLEED
jgi:hypothetical protein